MAYDINLNRKNASRSAWKVPGTRDTGQRYKVVYRDGMGTRRAYGFTESRDIAGQWVDAINGNALWDSPVIVDRKAIKRKPQ